MHVCRKGCRLLLESNKDNSCWDNCVPTSFEGKKEKGGGEGEGRGGLMTTVKKKKNQTKGSQNRFLSFSAEIPSHKDIASK